MGKLTTHVLDTSRGRPAAGMALRLYRDDEILVDTMTNADGRCDTPLLAGDTMVAGTYRLEFDAADYFRDCDVALPDPAFLDVIVIHFGIADAGSHYHVPLLVSPYAYSTYRGS